MSISLLSTKLYIPPARADIVSRPRLIDKLMLGVRQPLSFTLISGPAGFGKSTLLSEFAGRLDPPVAWVSLDEGDNDPVRFWRYVIAACQTLSAEIAVSAQEILQSPQPFPPDSIPTILINDLTSLDRDLVLVLDDYHIIRNEAIHAAFLFLLEHMPVTLHMVVSTRVDPPWPLARFRARNRLVEVRAQDLRFTAEEAAVFLNRVMGLKLAIADVTALCERAEGWIAGLQLAALSMQGRSDPAGFVRAFTGSHVYIAEYLVEEVLQRQSRDMQEFLLQTSILERLNAALCNAVTERQDGQEVLLALNRANLFVLPLDDEGNWFRYHHLFADLLQARLGQLLPHSTTAELHRRAAAWFERHGFVAEAVSHWLAARDFDAAARLIERHGNAMVTRGELSTLLQWTDSLPSSVIQQHPQIIIAKIWALALAGAVRQVEPLLQLAEAQSEGPGDIPAARELRGFTAAIRAFFAMMAGEDARALELAEQAELLLPAHLVHARWLLPYTTGAAYRGRGQFEKAAEAFMQQARMGEAYDNLVVWVTGITGVALVYRAQGRLNETSAICREAMHRLAERGAARSGALAKLEVPLIEVLRERNELDEAWQRMNDVMARMQRWPMPTDRLHALLALIEIQEAQGDLSGAFETLRTAKDVKTSYPVISNLARLVDLAEIRLLLESGDLAGAERLMDELQPGTSHWVEMRDRELLLLIRLRLAQGRLEEADSLLSSLAGDAAAGERKATLIQTLILQARSLYAQGAGEAARAVLAEALALAEPEGFVRTFVDEGEAVQKLLARAARHLATTPDPASRPSKTYLDKLLDAFPASQEPGGPPSFPDQASGLVEPLTPRENEVLQLVAAGDSNQQIAEKLVITISAVKKHTANIYGKLSANSRTQAVARARQLGLLREDR